MHRDPWAVMLEASRRRWGGDLRRYSLFRRLAERTDAVVIGGWGPDALRAEYGGLRTRIPVPRALVRRRLRPRLASSEMIAPDILRMASRVLDPAAVAVYDDALAQAVDLGFELPEDRRAYFVARKVANLRAFRWLVVPTASFADHIGLDASRVIVAGNGTDTGRIVPGEWPEDPAIGMVSGAAPRRGIETLIAAARMIHAEIPELRLLLWLAATGEVSGTYLAELQRSTARERWIEISTMGYGDLSHGLRQATVLTIPHPPGPYYDVALPVKLLDSMAAGRPIVATPRVETRAIIERHEVGVVSDGDSADDLAAALRLLIVDPDRARAVGEHAREIAETVYDWAVVGDRVADEVLDRERGSAAAA
jgi:glycosyltransferase involved in cell wall biosynthesis